MKDRLIIVVPCYNETTTLPKSSVLFLEQIKTLIQTKKISSKSRVLFVDDGSQDDTWEIIQELAKKDQHFIGIRQSRNRGHQNAVLAGFMEAKDNCDIAISIDCDGQDDISTIPAMVQAYQEGAEVVYGVRNNRKSDSVFKRNSAKMFYKLLHLMGVESVSNHADYRLVSNRVLQELANFKEVNLFLRGLFPLIGFKTAKVYYDRKPRIDGKSHYSLRKMFTFALDGITSFSIRPIRLILVFGALASFIGLCGIIYIFASFISGNVVSGWTSLALIVCFFGGVQTLSLGIIGEYIGKVYLETKARPRYIISERTYKRKP